MDSIFLCPINLNGWKQLQSGHITHIYIKQMEKQSFPGELASQKQQQHATFIIIMKPSHIRANDTLCDVQLLIQSCMRGRLETNDPHTQSIQFRVARRTYTANKMKLIILCVVWVSHQRNGIAAVARSMCLINRVKNPPDNWKQTSEKCRKSCLRFFLLRPLLYFIKRARGNNGGHCCAPYAMFVLH